MTISLSNFGGTLKAGSVMGSSWFLDFVLAPRGNKIVPEFAIAVCWQAKQGVMKSDFRQRLINIDRQSPHPLRIEEME